MKRFQKSEGFTLIELLIVIIIIGILAAIAIPMFLNQRDKAKESAVKEGVHSIQIGVQTYATDNEDVYPDGATAGQTVSEADIGEFVDNWPNNPWETAPHPMVDGGGQGEFDYTTNAGFDSFKLEGWGKGADPIITVGDATL